MRTKSHLEIAAHLRLAIVRTARRMRQEAHSGLTPSQGAALATIERHGPLTPSELADREGIRRPTATRMLATLEQAELATRTTDPLDGRSSLIAVTDAGRALLREARTRKDAFLARRLRDLPAEDRATLDRAATLLERLLEEERA